MNLKRTLYVLTLAIGIVAGGVWLNGSITTDAKAWSTADLYQQEHRNSRSTAEWTFKAFH